MINTADDPMNGLESINNTSVSPAIGIGAIALNFALKYHDINTVQDGTLYQQYKMEGKNMRSMHLSDVFETAILMELHLMKTSDRISAIVVDALKAAIIENDGAPVRDEGGV